MVNPKENRTHSTGILIERFTRKGYQCQELKEAQATILILRHEKKFHAEQRPPSVQQPYKDLMRAN